MTSTLACVSNGDTFEDSQSKPKRIYKKRPYVKRDNRKVAIPKVFRNDIRRQYSNMLTNVINSADFNLWSSFFTIFCTPNLHYVHMATTGVPISTEHWPNRFEMNNSFHCAQHMYNSTCNLPDLVMSIKDTKVFVGKEESYITIDFEFRGTHMYAVSNTYLEVPKPNKNKFVTPTNKHTNSFHQNSTNNDVLYESKNMVEIGETPIITTTEENSVENTKTESHSIINTVNTTTTDITNTYAYTPTDIVMTDSNAFLVDYVLNSGERGQLVAHSVQKHGQIMLQHPVTPTPLRFTGTFTLHIDGNKKIKKLNFATALDRRHYST